MARFLFPGLVTWTFCAFSFSSEEAAPTAIAITLTWETVQRNEPDKLHSQARRQSQFHDEGLDLRSTGMAIMRAVCALARVIADHRHTRILVLLVVDSRAIGVCVIPRMRSLVLRHPILCLFAIKTMYFSRTYRLWSDNLPVQTTPRRVLHPWSLARSVQLS